MMNKVHLPPACSQFSFQLGEQLLKVNEQIKKLLPVPRSSIKKKQKTGLESNWAMGRCSLERVVRKGLGCSMTWRAFNSERRSEGNSIPGGVNSICKRTEPRKNLACLRRPT